MSDLHGNTANPEFTRVYNVPAPDFEGDCAEIGGYPFFADDTDREGAETRLEAKHREHEARKVCAGCPALIACALHGLEHEEYGVWGGLSETDRTSLGGRGHGVGGGQKITTVERALRRAGIGEQEIREIQERWRERSAQIDADEEEVA